MAAVDMPPAAASETASIVQANPYGAPSDVRAVDLSAAERAIACQGEREPGSLRHGDLRGIEREGSGRLLEP